MSSPRAIPARDSDLAELLAGMLNAGLYPPIPEQGSVGHQRRSYAPRPSRALALLGEGILSRDGASGSAADMLRGAGLSPIEASGPRKA